MSTDKTKQSHETSEQFKIRFSAAGLHQQLKVRAAENNRSMNGEIQYLIKRGLELEQQNQGAQA